VARFIEESILSNHLRPGQHIVSDTVAKALGMSRLPVLQALRTLAGNGLVELHQNRGAFVADLGPDLAAAYLDLIDVLILLQPQAARLAATHVTPEGLAALDEAVAAGTSAHGRDPRTNNRAGHTFRRGVSAMAAKPLPAAALEPLENRLFLFFSQAVFRGDQPWVRAHPISWDQSIAIRDAVAAGDGESAARLTEQRLLALREAPRPRASSATSPHRRPDRMSAERGHVRGMVQIGGPSRS
jgi:DNA-binding GntR family transcriptional regulator